MTGLTGADPFDPANAPGTAAADTLPGGLPAAAPPVEDTAPAKAKRPTTRAERRAQAEANRLRREAAGLAPGKPSTKADTKPKGAKATPRRASLETRLTGSLTTLGTVIAATGGMVSPALAADGVLVVQHAPNVASALDKVAKDDPRVAAALEKMLTAGVWSGLVAAVLPLAVGIAANHGAIPASVAGMLGAEVPTDQGAEPSTAGPYPGPYAGADGFLTGAA